MTETKGKKFAMNNLVKSSKDKEQKKTFSILNLSIRGYKKSKQIKCKLRIRRHLEVAEDGHYKSQKSKYSAILSQLASNFSIFLSNMYIRDPMCHWPSSSAPYPNER